MCVFTPTSKDCTCELVGVGWSEAVSVNMHSLQSCSLDFLLARMGRTALAERFCIVVTLEAEGKHQTSGARWFHKAKSFSNVERSKKLKHLRGQ